MIDLHCHSHFSDGALSPVLLLNKAQQAGLRILALTDHDTIAGLAPLQDAARDSDITIINGIELSVRWKKHDIHIIGLCIAPDNDLLHSLIMRQNESRISRACQIGECLATFGVANAYQKACEIAGHERIGRPHFAQVLLNEGLVSDMQTAFKRYLGRGRGAYVPTNWISIAQAVEGIVAAGGQAIIAHPLKYDLTNTKLQVLINEFKEAGGAGLEVVSGEMTTTQINTLAGLCLRYNLLASTGSDFHSDISRIGLGRQQQLPVNCTPIWHQWNLSDESIICNTPR
jgi:3',5'-nucleoside bisphosphate phosphatase